MPRRADTVLVWKTEIDASTDKVVIPDGAIPPMYNGWTLTQECHLTPRGTFLLVVYATPPGPTTDVDEWGTVIRGGLRNSNGYGRSLAGRPSTTDLIGSGAMQAQLRKQKINRFKTGLADLQASLARVVAATEVLCHT